MLFAILLHPVFILTFYQTWNQETGYLIVFLYQVPVP